MILVTGGAGFMGSHVAKCLLNMNKEVLILDDLSGGFVESVPIKALFINGSILDVDLLKNIFEKFDITHIYHLAAYAAEGLSHFIKHFNYENNLIGSINLINCAINYNVKCFVFTSSMAVYGSAQVPFSEDIIPSPEDSYGIAKYAIEQELEISRRLWGLNYVIFRPHNVYGENQNIGDKYRNVVGIFMNQIMNKEPMTIYGDGEQKRAFSYIDDVAPAIAHSGFMEECYGEIFNIGADKPYTINELAKIIAKEMGAELNVKYLPPRFEVKYAYCNNDKSKKYFKEYIKNISLEEGIRRMAKWAKKVGARRSKKFKNIEIYKNLPSFWKKDFE